MPLTSKKGSSVKFFIERYWVYFVAVAVIYLSLKQSGLIERFIPGNPKIELYWHPGCGYCKQFLPEWKEFKDNIRGVDLEVIDHNCAVESCDDPMVDGYPTVILRRDGKNIQFMGERTKTGLHNFVFKGDELNKNLINSAI
jgi:thiol-disulfide isomerase/thioredoxin